jgi:hypothetical protein
MHGTDIEVKLKIFNTNIYYCCRPKKKTLSPQVSSPGVAQVSRLGVFVHAFMYIRLYIYI